MQVSDEQLALFNTMGWIIAWCTNTFYFSKTYVVQVSDEQLALLQEMGHGMSESKRALRFSGGDIAAALDFIETQQKQNKVRGL